MKREDRIQAMQAILGEMISWQGAHRDDHAATAKYHRDIAHHERSHGNHELAAKHDTIAVKYDKRAARAAKKKK